MAASGEGSMGTRALGLGALCLFMLAAPAGAQPATGFEDLAPRVKAGDRLEVKRAGGGKVKGHLLMVTGDELRLDVDGRELALPRADVRRVTVRKGRVGRSARNGLVAGLVLGAVGLAGFSGETRAEDAVAGAVMMGGFFGVVGAGVGFLRPSRTVVYDAPAGRAGARVSLVPHIARGTKGLAVGLSF
jgi:hypothetical protein